MNKVYQRIEWENEPSVKTPINEENLNRMDSALNEIDNRLVLMNTTKAEQSELLTTISDVTFDENTGEFIFTKKNGSSFRIDTKLEKLILNWRFEADTQTLYLIFEDGSEMPIDLSALIVPNEFIDSDTIYFTIFEGGKVTASIKNGAITPEMLEPNYLADITVQAEIASASAQNAQRSENNAKTSELSAKASEESCAEAVEEISRKTAETVFHVNFETGKLEYSSPSYEFQINNETGKLMWGVK